jgi:hypothetical protein
MINQKKSPFKNVSETLPFFPDSKNENAEKCFIGTFVASKVLGDSPNVADLIPVFVFAEYNTGKQHYITQSYAIKKAVDEAKKEFNVLDEVLFSFDFKGKTEVKGKPFNQFTTGYCTISEYESSLEPEQEVKPKAKK